MVEHDLEKSFMYWVGLASHLFAVSFNNELSGTGLTYRQAQVLICLEAQGGMSQNELAAQLQIKPPTIVPILDRMEKDGWIRRLPSSDDRRKKMVQQTKKAASARKLFVEIGMRIEKQASRSLSRAQLNTMRELLRGICENLGAEKCN